MSDRPNAPHENGGSEGRPGTRQGLSKEAWVAIGAIAAALITGTVTLLTHVLPKAPPVTPPSSSSPTPTTQSSLTSVSSPPIQPSPKSQPSGTMTADTIAGKWAGVAKDENGGVFQITLEVRKSCGLNDRCGSISVSHVPCHGEVFLEKIEGANFEFRVANFYGSSNKTVCQPGAGELFALQPNGKLSYRTTYEPRATGVLDKVGD